MCLVPVMRAWAAVSSTRRACRQVYGLDHNIAITVTVMLFLSYSLLSDVRRGQTYFLLLLCKDSAETAIPFRAKFREFPSRVPPGPAMPCTAAPEPKSQFESKGQMPQIMHLETGWHPHTLNPLNPEPQTFNPTPLAQNPQTLKP